MVVEKGRVLSSEGSQSMSIVSPVVVVVVVLQLLGAAPPTSTVPTPPPPPMLCALKRAESLFTSRWARWSSLRTICAATRPESSLSMHKLLLLLPVNWEDGCLWRLHG